jgi:hypothetical protein
MDVKWVEGEAWYNRMPGTDDDDLHVAGTCSLSSVSTELSLEPGDPGFDREPGVFNLQLTASTPDACLDQVDEGRQVEWRGDPGEEIKRVRIFGAVEALLDVHDAV